MLPHLMEYILCTCFYIIYIQREEREEREERRDKARRGEEREIERETERETSLGYIIYWGANTFPISRIKSKYLKPTHFLEQIM